MQFGCHVLRASAEIQHYEWLALGADYPRPAQAQALVDACQGVKTVLAYTAYCEKRCIQKLAGWVTRKAKALVVISAKTHDLLPVGRNHVYHPSFIGRISIKHVLPALLPGMGYDDLGIATGDAAACSYSVLSLSERR